MVKRPSPSFLIFPDNQGQWRWDFVGPKGRVIAVSQVGYPQPEGCARAIRLLREGTPIPILMRRSKGSQEQVSAGPQSALTADAAEGMLELGLDQIVR